jgi:predicted TIM-barrel fold metal-dependent hydrolase
LSDATTTPTTQPTPQDAVDVNVHLSRWPFRRLPLDQTPALVRQLRSLGVKQAWAGSFDALLHRDVAAVNARLAEECREHGDGMLIPFGTVSPKLPDWEEDLRRCREVHHMPGVRLYPNYHGYKLDDPLFARLLDLVVNARLLVQIAVSMEDERTQHPLVRVSPVDCAPMVELLAKLPAARVMLLNAVRGPRAGPASLLARTPQVSFDIATLETAGGVATLLGHVPAERIVFGTHAPYNYPEAAVLKMTESALDTDVARKISSGNASRLLAADQPKS